MKCEQCRINKKRTEKSIFCRTCILKREKEWKNRHEKKRRKFIEELEKEVDEIKKEAQIDRASKIKYSIRISSPYR